MKSIQIFLICPFVLLSCSFSEADFRDKVKLDFLYCRSGNKIVLGLTIKNAGSKIIYPAERYAIDFLVDGKVQCKPFIIYEEWLKKPIIPDAPKERYDYLDVAELSKLLRAGKRSLRWQYGPILSNEIVLEVTEKGEIRELSINCDDRAKRLLSLS